LDQIERDRIAALAAVEEYGSISAAAKALGLARQTVQSRYHSALLHQDSAPRPKPKPAEFEAEILPEDLPPAEEILARRRKQYARKKAADDARRLITVKVSTDGPFGICHLGDPHVDDDGTDVADIERHVKIINATEGLFGANVGDHQNNWVGRLARLYGEQSTSAAEAWVLTEWLVTSVNWLYILGGNHDAWSGAGDPVKWMTRDIAGISENWGARLNLVCPNGRGIRVNARHDFPGHSMWNTAHGAAKAAQMGWRDHVLICGHKHTSGYQLLKDPASGLISHVLRVAGFKILDRYAKELGLPDQNISPSATTIIDPQCADDDSRLITVIHDPEEAADFLTFKRSRK
jgi:hypothetical protein